MTFILIDLSVNFGDCFRTDVSVEDRLIITVSQPLSADEEMMREDGRPFM